MKEGPAATVKLQQDVAFVRLQHFVILSYLIIDQCDYNLGQHKLNNPLALAPVCSRILRISYLKAGEVLCVCARRQTTHRDARGG